MNVEHDTAPYRHMFAVELRKAMAARGVTGRSLAASVGISPRQVWFWMDGRSLPFLRTASRAADALSWDELHNIVLRARTVKCLACKRKLVTENSAVVRFYCDESCRKVGLALGRGITRVTPEDSKLAALQRAIADMCAQCEPAGLCRDGSCPLRGVSPLPVAEGTIVAVPTPDGRKSRWDHPEQRILASVAMKALWEGRDASKRRENTAAHNRTRWANMSVADRAALGKRISEGRKKAAWQ